MKKRPDIVKILTGGIIFCLGAYVIYNGSTRMIYEWKIQVNEVLQAKVEEAYMTGLTYINKEDRNPEEWIAKQALGILPLGNYIGEKSVYSSEVEDELTYEMILAKQAEDENEVDENGKLVKGDGAEAAKEAKQENKSTIDMSMEKMNDFDYLVNHFYIVDSSTFVNKEDLQAEKLLGTNVKIDKAKQGPKILLYHTHSQETFKDSTPGDVDTSIIGVGRKLSRLLNEKYGIETLHHEGIYDMENGKLDRSKAYQRAKPEIRKILKENPSIEAVIDLHRDGVREDTHLVTEIDGKPVAKVMFFNGLSRTRSNGNLAKFGNPYIQDNLALSLQMKTAAEKLYPGFSRKIYLKGYRYNMDMMPKSLLIECGAQTNTVEELMNAMDYLAETLNSVLVE